MAIGFLLIIVGAVMIFRGGRETRRRITEQFGEITPETMKMSEGTGVVPSSVSRNVLIGYALAVVGAITLIISLV